MDFTGLPDLASRRAGGGVLWANDELFAEQENLIRPTEPVYQPSTFGHKGQIYDGWETTRRREPGVDQAVIRLGLPGVVHGVVVDTAFFTGNYPPFCWVEAAAVEGYPSPAELSEVDWQPLVPRSPLLGNTKNPFDVDDPAPVHPRPADHRPGRRRGAAAGARHPGGGPEVPGPGVTGPGRAGERRLDRRLQQHVLLVARRT